MNTRHDKIQNSSLKNDRFYGRKKRRKVLNFFSYLEISSHMEILAKIFNSLRF